MAQAGFEIRELSLAGRTSYGTPIPASAGIRLKSAGFKRASAGIRGELEMVAPAGFEPAISALKGPRPRPLDDGASLEV